MWFSAPVPNTIGFQVAGQCCFGRSLLFGRGVLSLSMGGRPVSLCTCRGCAAGELGGRMVDDIVVKPIPQRDYTEGQGGWGGGGGGGGGRGRGGGGWGRGSGMGGQQPTPSHLPTTVPAMQPPNLSPSHPAS